MKAKDQRLKPQDVILALKLALGKGKPKKMLDLAYELGISQSQISYGMERLARSGLIDADRNVMRQALIEFLLFGLKYVYPAQPGHMARGVATAHSAKPLSSMIKAGEKYVWPWPEGDDRGQAIHPLYESAPKAALADPRLYELLALVDAIRVGRAREQEIARKEIRSRLEG